MIEEVNEFLKSQGLMPKIDEGNNIVFRYQMKTYVVLDPEEDEQFLRIAMPGIFEVDDNNRADVLQVANNINKMYKIAKCIVLDETVWITTEQLIDSTPNFEDIIPRLLNIIFGAHQDFYKGLNL